ncbi:hypothetical protein [Halocatena halophila]|uniref:hypothetical protein n=1 Tax=Halocatena halophila TaxID=2814576 RepID=UPI002ED32FEB
MVVVILLMGSLGSTFFLSGASAQQTPQSDDWGTNALVIKYVGESNSDSASYVVDFTGEVHSVDTEPEDGVYKNRSVMGEVSPSDSTDTIRYSGDIKRIKTAGDKETIRLYVNSKEINENNYQPDPQTTSTPIATEPPNHTLVIQPKGDKRGSYNAVFSSQPTLKQTEDSDTRKGTKVNGNVGGLPWQKDSTDKKDVIQFRGQVQDFETSGNITVKLDGTRVDPTSLSQSPQPTASPPSQEESTHSPTSTVELSPSTIQSTQGTAADSGGFPLFEVLAGVVAGVVVVMIGGFLLQKKS